MPPAGRGRLLLALTSHGLGHLTRSLAMASELHALDPGLELVVATTVPEKRVARDLPAPFEYRPVTFEPGTLQRNCFELDLAGTRTAYRGLLEQRARQLEAARDLISEAGCTAVMSDVPALPVRAAAELGLPGIAVSNFTWDWILEPLLSGPGAGPEAQMVELLASDYASGAFHLRLPFGPDSSPFPRSEPAPLVCRSARLTPEQTRRRLGLPPRESAHLVLVCPGGWSPDGWQPIEVGGCEGMRFLAVGDLPLSADVPLHGLPHDLPDGIGFPDLVAAADAVLAKPGYGIASECALHQTPLVTIERPGFRETPVLLEGFRRLGPCAEITLADFFAGRWEPALLEVLESGMAWSPSPPGGAARVAERLLGLLDSV